jgi:hypothetical protein
VLEAVHSFACDSSQGVEIEIREQLIEQGNVDFFTYTPSKYDSFSLLKIINELA